VEFAGWPAEVLGLQPFEPDARAIAGYFKANRLKRGLPDQPFDKGLGRIFLPALELLPVEKQDGMPVYKVKRELLAFGGVIEVGETVVYLGWMAAELGLQPENDSARSVLEFAARFDIGDLYPSCWDAYSNSLALESRRATVWNSQQIEPSPLILRPVTDRDPPSRRLVRKKYQAPKQSRQARRRAAIMAM
jgi:hypothetical protein